VQLRSQSVQVNCVLIGSANELHLGRSASTSSTRASAGRLELVRAPYLLLWLDEKKIYDAQIAPQARKHVAPHATELAAMFAVLTRMRRPERERYEGALKTLVENLTASRRWTSTRPGTPPGTSTTTRRRCSAPPFRASTTRATRTRSSRAASARARARCARAARRRPEPAARLSVAARGAG
jgi:hypothetical protein